MQIPEVGMAWEWGDFLHALCVVSCISVGYAGQQCVQQSFTEWTAESVWLQAYLKDAKKPTEVSGTIIDMASLASQMPFAHFGGCGWKYNTHRNRKMAASLRD